MTVREIKNKRTVWKYEIPLLADEFRLEIPRDPVFLCIQIQQGLPMMWVEVDPTEEMETCRFRIVGTGHEFEGVEVRKDYEENGKTRSHCIKETYHSYIGTFQMLGGSLVWHLYQVFTWSDEDEDVTSEA